MKNKVDICFVVARAENNVIGQNCKLPWRISLDMQHFKKLTVGKPIIMGRKTYESIGRPLPRRTNIILSRNSSWKAEGVITANDLATAKAMALENAYQRGIDEIIVIGGGEVFPQFLSITDKIYLTEVHKIYKGDTKFDFDRSEWVEKDRQYFDEAAIGEPPFSFVTLIRKSIDS